MKLVFKIKIREIPYFLALFLLCFSVTVVSNSYVGMILPPQTNTILKYIEMILFFLSILNEKWGVTKLMIWCVVGVLTFTVSIIIDYPLLILYILAVIAADRIDFEKIKVATIFNNIFCVVLVLALCAIGLIPNQVYNHGGLKAYSLGFLYYSNLSGIVFFTSLLALSRNKKGACSWNKIIFWLIVNYLVYRVGTTRLSFYITCLMLVLIIVMEKFNLIKLKNNKLTRAIVTTAYPMAALTAILIAIFYNQSVSWMRELNEVLNTRIRYSHEGLLLYPITLFGNQIKMVGSTEIANHVNKLNEYFYIDCGYIYSLLRYGLVIFILVIIGYSIIFRYSIKKKDKLLFIYCLIVCIHSLINNTLISFELNPLLLSLPTVMKELISDRKEKLNG